mgnify:CR=1 FL=1
MKLTTIYTFESIKIENNQDNNTTIIASKVKITNKAKQSAQNAKEKIELQYSSSIDKGAKKRAFFAKHKK